MEFDDKSKMTMFDVDGKNVSRAEFYLVDGETHGHKPLMLGLFWNKQTNERTNERAKKEYH